VPHRDAKAAGEFIVNPCDQMLNLIALGKPDLKLSVTPGPIERDEDTR
jgi:hypothetical protein